MVLGVAPTLSLGVKISYTQVCSSIHKGLLSNENFASKAKKLLKQTSKASKGESNLKRKSLIAT